MSRDGKRKVVVTGMGAVTPIGLNVPEIWENAKKGVCGIGEITRYDTTDRQIHIAGEVKGFVPENSIDKKDVRKMDLYTQYAVAAAVEAMKDAGFSGDEKVSEEMADRFGVLISSGVGGIGTIENEHAKGEAKGFDRVSPFYNRQRCGYPSHLPRVRAYAGSWIFRRCQGALSASPCRV